eukprot:GFUD01013650.1.p1 GENE.GFUD01013650.1~~GFUD01013650.1.p1  ORF type:complete len:825 (+),score=137.26 GFUD01013650.1:131-2605(+)
MRVCVLGLCWVSFICVGLAQINFGGSTSRNSGRSSVNVGARVSSNSRGSGSSRASVSGSLSSQTQGSSNSFNSRISVQSNSGCLPPAQCSSILFTSGDFSRSKCSLFDGSQGFSCSSRTFVGSSRRPFKNADSGFISTRANNRGTVNVATAFRSGQTVVSNMTSFSSSQFRSPRKGTGAYYHSRFQRQARSSLQSVGRAGLLATQAAIELSNDISTRQGGRDGTAVNFGPSVTSRQNIEATGQSCSSSSSCFSRLYRSADGSCNNLREARYGKSDTALNRILPPEYSNGIDTPRRSTNGGPLPSSRLVSTSLAKDFNNQDQRYTYLTMTFGQFVDHDLTHSPILKNGNNQDIDCCSSSAGSDFQSFCDPIDIPRNDPFFQGRSTCMNLVRSTPAPALDCSVRYREQVNQLTHWLDSSQIYGSNDQEQRGVRTFSGGRLQTRSGPDNGRQILPSDNQESSCTGTCFKAGDGRVNENPNLSVMHTIWLREHNRVADQMSRLNPGWSDEKLYQEAKRFVNAEYQHIIYNEWLPTVIGKQYMNLYGLFPLSSGYSNDYDTSFDPRITNEFATAAFRFGHSLIPGIINVYNTVGRNINPTFQLKNAFNKPELLRLNGMFDGLVAGLTRDKIQKFDSGFVDDITNNLFDGDKNGMDLVALNIQRGREHGLAGYNKYRDICGLGRASSFSDMSRQMSLRRTQELQQLYNNVDDTDLFVGLFSERPASGAMVGPTTLCIIGDQFARLKKGDRYFYDLDRQSGSFSSTQLQEIRKASMSRILCDNSGVGQLQPLAFQVPSDFNPVLSCDSENVIPRPDIRAWQEGNNQALRRG